MKITNLLFRLLILMVFMLGSRAGMGQTFRNVYITMLRLAGIVRSNCILMLLRFRVFTTVPIIKVIML